MIDVTIVPSLLCGVVWEIRSREFIISGFSQSELKHMVHSIINIFVFICIEWQPHYW